MFATFLKRKFGKYRRKIVNIKKQELEKCKDCGRALHNGKLMIVIKGRRTEIKGRVCVKECVEKYLNRYSTICAGCDKPIVPGTPVAVAWDKAPYPYQHAGCANVGLYCGVWTEKGMSLHPALR